MKGLLYGVRPDEQRVLLGDQGGQDEVGFVVTLDQSGGQLAACGGELLLDRRDRGIGTKCFRAKFSLVKQKDDVRRRG